MLAVRVPKQNAERARKYLARQKLTVNNYRISRDVKFIYFPIAPADGKGVARELKAMKGVIIEKKLQKIANGTEYRRQLSEQLGNLYNGATKSYDIVGDIALIDENVAKTAKTMAGIVMGINKNVKTVLAKVGPVSGVYRIRKFKYITGEKKYYTIYRENGCAFKIDVRKSFFSSRLAYERKRVCDLVKKNENVMVMFAGVGPFAVEIGKAHKDSKVVAIELNKDAYKYMLDNIKLNKTPNVQAMLGDVKKVANDYKNFADRIIMPLPMESYRFLDSVAKVARKRCVVHYYAFGNKDTGFKDTIQKLHDFFKSKNKKIKINFMREVRTYSASEIEVVIDFTIS